MAALLQYGTSTRDQKSLIYCGFEYVKEHDNVIGTTAWCCRFHTYVKYKSKACVVTDGFVLVADKQPEHTRLILPSVWHPPK
uniref:FLYWCH-type domain-containing protein n=1 Tax=Strigamia maritima TaxID=126957 RepID=T1JC21_STRMM